MELLGIGGILFWVGLAMFAAGQALVWTRLARYDGLDKRKTLHVIFDDDSPMKRPENRRDRRIFRAGIFLIALGMMNLFTGISGGDQRELAVCSSACRRAGYYGGQFAPSSLMKAPGGKPVRGCWCVGPAGSTELPQNELYPPSAPALP